MATPYASIDRIGMRMMMIKYKWTFATQYRYSLVYYEFVVVFVALPRSLTLII